MHAKKTTTYACAVQRAHMLDALRVQFKTLSIFMFISTGVRGHVKNKQTVHLNSIPP